MSGRRVGWRAARLAIALAVVVAGTVSLLSAASGATSPPDLTGSWINPQAPTALDWSLQSSASRLNLSAKWHGTAAQGHPTLAGSFSGTLDPAGDAYSGRYNIHESGSDFPGGMTITSDSPDQITVTLTPDSGGSDTIIFDRATASAEAPPMAWCSSVGSANPSCESDPTTMAPGSDSIDSSSNLSSGQQSATVEVTSTDAASTDVVVATPPAGQSTPLHAADCVKVAGALVSGAGALRVDLDQATWEQIQSESGGPNAVLFAYALLACLDVVHTQDASTAAVARVSCPVSARALKITHASHTSISFTQKRGGVKPPVIVSCTRQHGKLIVHVRTRSRHATLRQVLGKRLLVGVYLSAGARSIATARVTFAKR